MTSRTFVHAELHKSALNVRTNEKDAQATRALAESILRRGLLQPISVHPTEIGPEAPTPWGVFAGGRRLHAIGQLIAAGQLPADWPIPATILDACDAEIIEMSLGENILRVDLRPYEVHTAVAQAFAHGDSVETISANLGQSEEWVRKQLRLGQLAPPIFDAYAIGELSYDHAAAYAATADAELQLMVFDAMRGEHSQFHTPARIRAALKVGDREASRLLLFVGEAVYVANGGMIEPDLFADGRDARIRITDEPLLRRLAEERMKVERERVRAEAARPDLQFAVQPPQFAGRNDEPLEIQTDKLPVHRFPKDAIVATIDVDDHGNPYTRIWWASRAAKGAAEKGKPQPEKTTGAAVMVPRAGEAFVGPDSAYAQNARAIVRDEYGLTADGIQLFRSLRRSLLRRLLIEQGGGVARDYIVWAQARALVAHALPAQTGCRAIVGEWHDGADRAPTGLYESFIDDVAAEHDWNSWIDGLKAQPFMIEEDPAISLSLFLELDQAAKDQTAAIVAGKALIRSADTPGFRVAAHDVLARACGASAAQLRRWWTPSTKWIGLFGRMFRLATVQPFVDAATHAGFTRLKDPDLTAAAVAALDPDNHNDEGARTRAAHWLPDLVAFGPDPGDGAAPPAADDPAQAQREKVKKQLRGRANAARVREAVG